MISTLRLSGVVTDTKPRPDDGADQVLDDELHAERRDEHREERRLMPLDRPVDEALHQQAEHRRGDHRRKRRDRPGHVQLRGEPPVEIAADRERRAVRDVEDLGRAEDQREADRSQRVDRAELQPVDEELKQHHDG